MSYTSDGNLFAKSSLSANVLLPFIRRTLSIEAPLKLYFFGAPFTQTSCCGAGAKYFDGR